ncbi:outer membrane beta-barrel protein [Joostella sp. CR20]|uniref:outer membrane beta-barrel protein n=1 Tax=Joostella sp. CR20 TaxID=2804312 RepID=UPI00313B4717
MKKQLLLTLLLFVAFTVSSQIDRTNEKAYIPKGKWMTSGTISIDTGNGKSNYNYEDPDYVNTSESENIRFSIAPKTGYSFAKNWIVGVGIGYIYDRNKSKYFENDSITEKSEYTSNSFSINPFVRRYISVGKNLTFFFQGETNFQYSKSKAKDFILTDPDNEDNFTSKSIFVGIRPGLNYFFNDHWALETTVGRAGYQHTNNDNDINNFGVYESNRFFIDLNLTDVYFGVSYFF